MRLGVLTTVSLLALAGATGAVFAPRVERALWARRPVVCDGHRLPDELSPSAWVSALAGRAGHREAYLKLPEGLRPVTFEELGLELDARATLSGVMRALPKPTLGERLQSLWAKPADAPSVALAFGFDAARARAFLAGLAPELHRDAVDARLDLVAHQRVADAPGRDLDIDATLAAIESGERRDLAVFDVAFTTLTPAVGVESLLTVDVTKVLGSFETDFSKKPRSRVPNIRRAAQYLNGVVIGPGETFSFNRVVGPRTLERGFRNAPVIVADELEEGLGGGVCQVASTVFAASMLGGLEIVTRRSHSRPSGYAPLGLDAAVIFPEVDLRLRNPYPLPVILHAFLPDESRVRVELLGLDPPGKIEHFFGVETRDPFVRRVVVKSELMPGTVKKKQDGYAGYDGQSLLRTTLRDGSRHTRSYSSKYYPVPEVYWVASDVDPRQLPPLPEGATSVEVTDETSARDGETGDAREP